MLKMKPRSSGKPPAEFIFENVQYDPGIEVFVKRLIQFQLLGPLAVIAFVGHVDAGLGDFQFIQHLNRFKFHIAGAGQPGGNNVLGQLGMRSGRHAEGCFQELPVALHSKRNGGMRNKEKIFGNTQNMVLLIVAQNPSKQRFNITAPEFVTAHGITL